MLLVHKAQVQHAASVCFSSLFVSLNPKPFFRFWLGSRVQGSVLGIQGLIDLGTRKKGVEDDVGRGLGLCCKMLGAAPAH